MVRSLHRLSHLEGASAMTRYQILAACIIAAIVGYFMPLPAQAADGNMNVRWEHSKLCVTDQTGNYWVTSRVRELDRHPDLDVTVRTGACTGFKQRVIIRNVWRGKTEASAITIYRGGYTWQCRPDRCMWEFVSPVIIELNRSHARSATTWGETALHEMMHAVSGDKHTTRCDSIRSNSYDCIHQSHTLTQFDYAELEALYPW